jgi:hypothetical protein
MNLFRPDFCQAADPKSKGIVEHLVGYAKRDLMIPQAPFAGLAAGNAAAAAWCAEVNGAVHGEIRAVLAEQLVTERELLARRRRCAPASGGSCPARWTGCRASGSGRPATPSRSGSSASRSG